MIKSPHRPCTARTVGTPAQGDRASSRLALPREPTEIDPWAFCLEDTPPGGRALPWLTSPLFPALAPRGIAGPERTEERREDPPDGSPGLATRRQAAVSPTPVTLQSMPVPSRVVPESPCSAVHANGAASATADEPRRPAEICVPSCTQRPRNNGLSTGTWGQIGPGKVGKSLLDPRQASAPSPVPGCTAFISLTVG